MVIYIEKEKKKTKNFSYNSIIDEFKNLKNKVQSFIYVWFML